MWGRRGRLQGGFRIVFNMYELYSPASSLVIAALPVACSLVPAHRQHDNGQQNAG